MKKKMLMALWAFYALTITTTYAQEEKPEVTFNDTLQFIPDENTKVLLIGNNLMEMSSYSKIDSLKMLLLNDLEKAQSTISDESKIVHYFVHPNGKRRLKAENADFPEQEINIEKEKALMGLDLPPYLYVIHDLSNDYNCYIYLKNPSEIKALSNVSFYDAITIIKKDKSLLKRNYRIDLSRNNNQWEIKDKFKYNLDQLELSPNFGFGLLGSRWAPVAGLEVALKFTNKYGVQKYKIGGAISAYTFTEFRDRELSDLNTVISYDVKLLGNLSVNSSRKPKWFGIEGGYLTENKNGPLNNTYKFGITSEGFGAFNVSFDIYFPKAKKSFYGITLRVPF